jgi:hypothetical protein
VIKGYCFRLIPFKTVFHLVLFLAPSLSSYTLSFYVSITSSVNLTVLPVKYGVISSLPAAGQTPNLPENPYLPSCKTYSLVLYSTYLAWCLSVRFPRSICNKWQSRHYHCNCTELNSLYTIPASYVVTTDWYRVRIKQ